jgi:outer membrane protein OmpA-like peptidoglycan-associated protein
MSSKINGKTIDFIRPFFNKTKVNQLCSTRTQIELFDEIYEYIRMKKYILFLFFTATGLISFCQTGLYGTWQGILLPIGQMKDKSIIFYLKIDQNKDRSTQSITGTCREEYFSTDQMVVKSVKGMLNKNTLQLTQGKIEKSWKIGNKNLCPIDITLNYNDSSGYLTGSYNSPTCRSISGNIILFKSSVTFTLENDPLQPHDWRNRFLLDLEKGYPSPEVRKKERDNFVFQPIYFDYDSSSIDRKYTDYLSKLARIIHGHSDIRVKVTGHTDADGSFEYNNALSEKRAKAIIDFFRSLGVDQSRIEIEFKGESQPIESNSTENGKQRNRRVEFAFI